ncbi:putative Homeobox protein LUMINIDEPENDENS [Melia azedarach]|uniref:Homeobox protein LUMINIDEPENDENS n=1 Tax=Melia azedarach TaxID=155640 RepID=A0ACC1YV41_MELAZ|nr:putative Homeobox protein LUMINIDEPENDENS [Melia azedarach]
MESLKENSLETEIGSSVESFQKFLDSQRELFHSQIEQLQNVVVTQCRLTGVNPLSQEMAAGALSIKIGKRPRDLLNPKALKYMQEVFSVKDAISKRESREISAQFGVTVTQVKDFFASQRSRVRKLVRLSREKAIKSNACKEPQNDGVPISSDSMIPIDPMPLSSAGPTSVIPIDHLPLNSIGPLSVEEAPSCSGRDDSLVGIDDLDKHFVENIFSLMRKEETFSGQVKLMEWILQIENSSVLFWFLTKGGVMILATWMSQAADEEQTSVLSVILDVYSHLPLHKAFPEQMSAILQSVKRLRFYRASDLTNRARILLSKWSKLFARSQALKKPNGTKSCTDAENELILKQSIGEIMADESWQSNNNVLEASLASSYESSENFRKLEAPQPLKLLTASSDDSARKNILGASSSYNRERRKVQFVEQLGQKMPGRSPQATRAAPVSQARPMSADDIQKAKLRAMHMQNKYGKIGSSSNGSNEVKTEGLNKSTTTQASIVLPVSKALVRPQIEEHKKSVMVQSKISCKLEDPLDSKQKMDTKVPSEEKCNRVLIRWQTPPEVKLNAVWRVGAGDNSKEVEVQKNRTHREKETIYHAVQEIPSNPKEPWDLEMDYDDTLTLEIPTEQPPDAADSGETQVATTDNVTVNSAAVTVPVSSQIGDASTTGPDLELLAVLLKNPELVFALTSGQAGNLSNEDTVKLLDMIKAGGAGLPGNINGIGGKVGEKVEVSLPSPTPSSNPGTSGWRQEVRNPFSRRSPMAPEVASAVSSVEKHPPTNLVRSGISAMNVAMPQQPTIVSQQVPASMSSSLHQTNTIIAERQEPSVLPSLHQSRPISSPIIQTQASEIQLPRKILPIVSTSSNINATGGPSIRIENNLSNATAAPMHNNAPERQYSLPTSMPMPTPVRSQPQQHFMTDPAHVASSYASRQPMGNLGPASDSGRAIQRFASNPRYQVNQNNYNAPSFGGPVQQPQLLSGSRRERNGYASNDGFESWSPENSPTRSTEYMSRRNFPEPRSNAGWSSAPVERSRQWNSSGYREVRDHNKHGNMWRDRRR